MTSAAEAEVRERIETWAAAVRAHDLAGVLRHHASDIVYFDVPPPVQRGLGSYERSWPPFFEYIGRRGQFELDQLAVTAGSDVAFAHAILRVRGDSARETAAIRLTVGLRKSSDGWEITHEHHSAPYTPAPSEDQR